MTLQLEVVFGILSTCFQECRSLFRSHWLQTFIRAVSCGTALAYARSHRSLGLGPEIHKAETELVL